MGKIQKIILATALGVGLLQFTPLIAFQQEPLAKDPGVSQQMPKESSFKGKIEKEGDKYLLKTAKASYDLDDQEKAKSFEGKDVKVTGSLDASTKTIHVTNIEPAA